MQTTSIGILWLIRAAHPVIGDRENRPYLRNDDRPEEAREGWRNTGHLMRNEHQRGDSEQNRQQVQESRPHGNPFTRLSFVNWMILCGLEGNVKEPGDPPRILSDGRL